MTSKKWDVFLVALIFASLCCIFYAHVIFFDEIFIKRDIGRYYYPLRILARQIFESGGFPFWNPYLFCGIPLFATIQSCVLYPVSIICYFGNFYHAFNVFVLFHIFLAGIFMYVLMKSWRLSRFASFLAAASFAFSGYMISAINLTISLCSAAWFPLLLYFYGRLPACRQGRLRRPFGPPRNDIWTVFSAVTLLMMLLAGDPAIVFISVLVLFCISLYLFLEDASERKTFSLNRFKPFFITLILFLLLSAFQTLPFLEFVRLTDRNIMPWKVMSGWSVPPSDLISLAMPFFNDINWYFGDYWQVQSWLDNYYMGLIPLFLAFVAAFFDKSKKTNFLILFVVCALALALGRYTVIYAILVKALPVFRLVRYPVRFFFLFAFGIAALAGIGLDYFGRNIKTDIRLQKFSRGLLILSFLTAISLVLIVANSGKIFVKLWNFILPLVDDKDPKKNLADLYSLIYMNFYNFKRILALLAAFGLLFFIGSKKSLRTGICCFALTAISLADVVFTNLKYEPMMSVKEYIEPPENIKFLQKDKTLFRIACSPQIGRFHTRLPEKTYAEGIFAAKDRLMSNRMVEYGIFDISGYDSMYLSRTRKMLELVLDMKKPSDTRMLDMLNVKYVCVTPKTDPQKEGYRLANKTKVAHLYENLNCLPRAYLADKAVVITDEKKIIEKLKDKVWDPRREVILEEIVPQIVSRKSSVVSRKSVEIASYKPNEVIIKAATDSPKFLVLADNYYPGWRVYVDGKRDKIYRANYILRAVYLKEPGEHIIRFKYDPFSFKLGLALTLLGTVLCAVAICGLRTVPKHQLQKYEFMLNLI